MPVLLWNTPGSPSFGSIINIYTAPEQKGTGGVAIGVVVWVMPRYYIDATNTVVICAVRKSLDRCFVVVAKMTISHNAELIDRKLPVAFQLKSKSK